jgi:hypothetical protein
MSNDERKIHRDPGLQERLNDELAESHLLDMLAPVHSGDDLSAHQHCSCQCSLFDAIQGRANRTGEDEFEREQRAFDALPVSRGQSTGPFHTLLQLPTDLQQDDLVQRVFGSRSLLGCKKQRNVERNKYKRNAAAARL